jgi:putative tryptophan/tyrosine transport system substrate-binding protein
MRRREFITQIGGGILGAAVRSVALRAEPAAGKPAKIGFLYPGPEAVAQSRSALLLEGMRSEGIDPQTVTLMVRGTDGDTARIGPLFDELIAAKPDLLIPVGPPVTRVAHATNKTIPMVTFDMETDPIEAGWLQSYAHPGGALTGVFLDFPDFSTKWLELLKEAVPKLANIVVLWDPTTAMVQTKAVAEAARLVNVNSEVLEVRAQSEIPSVFAAASARRPDGMLILSSPVASIYSKDFADMALKYRLPAISIFANFPRAGGLMSYGPELADVYRETGIMAAKVLKGSKPADLPAERPSRFELVVNMLTAKAMNLTISPVMQQRADEVIE